MKSNIIVGIICFALLLVGVYQISILPEKLIKVHQYDYIIEVDGTDSVEIYHLYDNRHREIGEFRNTDSLKTLIYEDNM